MRSVCILPGDAADPSFLKDGNAYYLVCTSLRRQPGLTVYRSEDLFHWTPLCQALTEDVGEVWGTDLAKHNGRYYIFFPALARGTGTVGNSGTVFAISAEQLEGPWSKPEKMGVYGFIDPGFATDGEKSWLFFNRCSFAPLDESCLHVTQQPQKNRQVWPIPEDWETEGVWDEGSKIFQKNGWYYLLTAQGGTAGPATSHMAICYRAKQLEGPWELSPYNPVVHTYSSEEDWWSIGHTTYFEDLQGNAYFIYHGYRKDNRPEGRSCLLCKACWTEDGWPVAQELEEPDSVYPDVWDDFSSEALDLNWTFYEQRQPERFCTGSGLTLKGAGSSLKDSCPLQYHNYFPECRVCVTVDQPEKDAGAGLAFYYNPKAYLGIYRQGDALYIDCQGIQTEIGKVSSEKLTLMAEKKGQIVRFSWQEETGVSHTLAESFDVSGFHHNNYRGFTALMPSLTCFGEGSARFEDFRYEKL